MTRLTPLLLIGLAGCWPRIPGSWDDYSTPDETRIAGYLFVSEPQGGYWTDDSPTADAVLGWYGAPKLDVDLFELFHPTGDDGCSDASSSDQDWLYDGFDNPGPSELTLHGPSGDIALEYEFFSNTPDAYGANPDPDDVPSDTIYALLPFESPIGTVSVEELVRMPRPLGFDGPQMDGTDPEVIDIDDLTFTWVPRDTQERVLARAFLVDADYNTLEVRSCLAPMSAGTITVDDDWNELGDGIGLFFSIAVASERTTVLEGEATASRVLAVHEELGFFSL